MLEKRSFSLAGHRTSIALEPEFWSALGRLALDQNKTVGRFVADIDAGRVPGQNLASALRVAALLRSLS